MDEEESTRSEKVRYPSQFVKYPYVKQKKSKSWQGIVLFLALLLFLFSAVDLIFWNYLGDLVRLFPVLYLLLLFISGKDLIENRLKIFWLDFDFYFFLFLSSFVVLVLVSGTLVFDHKSILILLGLLLSFLFFFVGYLFVKNQWFRFFFRMIYSRIYFVLILLGFAWTLFAITSKEDFQKTFDKISQKISSIFEKENEDPLLLDEQWELISSGVIKEIVDQEEFLFEESGEVLSPSVNPIFISEDENVENNEEVVEKVSKDSLMTELSLKESDSISMLDSLKFLMEYYDIELSNKTNTRFTYVSLQNANYPYWKTAYEHKMIWASNNPATKISCETYQVFKWMLLGWDLIYDSSNVKKVFWDEAAKRNDLNGCEYGKLLKWENL